MCVCCFFLEGGGGGYWRKDRKLNRPNKYKTEEERAKKINGASAREMEG